MEHNCCDNNKVWFWFPWTWLPVGDEPKDNEAIDNRKNLDDQGDDETEPGSNSSFIFNFGLIRIKDREIKDNKAEDNKTQANASCFKTNLSLRYRCFTNIVP